MSLTRDQARRNLIETARSDARRHGIPILLAVADALDEAEATITVLREALRGLMAAYNPGVLSHVRQDADEAARRALACPEFPDTEKGDGR